MDEIGKKKVLHEFYISIRVMFFGVFRKFYGFSGFYITFLNLNFADSKENEGSSLKDSLALLDSIFRKNSKKRVAKGVHLLLKSINWRLHLVALMTILKMEKREQVKFHPSLWELVGKEFSWVLPQIYATISLIDESFSEKAKLILKKKGCNILDNKECEIDYLLENLECMEEVKEDYDAHSVYWRRQIIKLKEDNSYQFLPTIL